MVLRRLLPLLLLYFHQGFCEIEFRNWTVPDAPGWSMSTAVSIAGWRGRSAVLPCTFTYPGPAYQGNIVAIWSKAQAAGQKIIFQCSYPKATSELVQCLEGNDQYRLVGKPRQNVISLEFRNLSFEDISTYYCRVELTASYGAKWESQYPTALLVIAPASILSLKIIGNNTVVCEAEGNPKPNITWISDSGRKFAESPDTSGDRTSPYIRKSMITVIHNGSFTCVARNEYGFAQAEVGKKPPEQFPVLMVVIPVLSLLLLGLLLGLSLLCWKRKGSSCKTFPNRRSSDIVIFTNEEVKGTETVSEENQEGYTYADIIFTKDQKQAPPEHASSDSPNNAGDVTYAVVAVHK